MENSQKPDSELEQTVEAETKFILESDGFTIGEGLVIIATIGFIYALCTDNILEDFNWAYENIINLGKYIGSYFY